MSSKGRRTSERQLRRRKNHEKELRESDSSGTNSKTSSIAQIAVSQWVWVLSLIFGGCCSNVFTLESIVNDHPKSGHLITLCQFLFVSLEGFIYFFDGKQPMLLKPSHVPFTRWILPVVIFYTVSTLNNWALAFEIPIPFHIVFRSGGTATTMVLGFLFGKRYASAQILGVLVLTGGIILSTLSQQQSSSSAGTTGTSLFGIAILVTATILGSLQGVIAEKTYDIYGRHWRESLFYTHFFSLVLFLPLKNQIYEQFIELYYSKPYITLLEGVSVSKNMLMLLLNALTQYICVRGVNNLAGHMSALTVTIVLNLRKFTSLLISIYLFGNEMTLNMAIGTSFVFGGALLYSISGTKR